MKYPLSPELSKLKYVKTPKNIYLYPFVNLYLRLFTIRPDDKALVEKIRIPTEDGSYIRAFVISPKGQEDKLPCLIHFHGGGFLIKASGAHCKMAKLYAEKTPCKVIFPDYRLMPRYRFPVAIKDCFATYSYIEANAGKLGIDKDRIVLTGDSAGANISAAISLMRKDKGLDLPKGVMLIYPVVDRTMSTGSMKRFTDTPVWDSGRTVMFWREYLKRSSTEPIRYAAPMEAVSLGDFPKTYMEVAEFDCLHDEGVAFAERLEEEEIQVDLFETKAACHGYDEAIGSSLVTKAVERRINWLREIFKDPEN